MMNTVLIWTVIPAVEVPPRIFGVDLHVSIKYANVAISLMNENGESFIYGYVPIVVAKCGVFLKEKGEAFLYHYVVSFLIVNSNGCPGHISSQRFKQTYQRIGEYLRLT